MQGKSLFLDRAVSRSHDWAPRFPALSMACREAGSISRGRQVVVAAADDTGIRCTFFTNLGAVLEFSATWAELEQARTWWHFVRQWNSGSSISPSRCSGFLLARQAMSPP